jgi:hypothetical protein
VGAHQIGPDIAYLGAGKYVVTWCDMRSDPGDIFVQFGIVDGALLGTNQKVNQDDAAFLQADPSAGGASNGSAIIAWQDARQDGDLFGLNILARCYDSTGTPIGDEFVLNDDTSAAVRAEPAAAQAVTGRAMVVWRDARNGSNDIYGQRIAESGLLDATNFKINTDALLVENHSPKVGMADDDRAVVAWRAIAGGISQIHYQIIDPDGTPVGSNTPFASGIPAESQTDFDLAVNPVSGEFVIAWISETESDGIAVMAQKFTELGLPIQSSLLLSTLPAAGGGAISTAIDASGNYSVSWTDSRSGYRRVYMTTVRTDNTLGSLTSIISPGVVARGEHSSLTMTGDDILAVWSDNRESGNGYDVYLNTYGYSTSPVEEIDDPVVPSGFALAQNYPNPFNPTTVIRFHMPESGEATLEICNTLGQVVSNQRWSWLAKGWHEYEYNASDQPSGIYLYRIRTDRYAQSRKMVLVK